MSDNSRIEWTDATWNPTTGCTKVSPGCDHCYAEGMFNRFNGPGAFDTVQLRPERLDQPLRWRKPRRVFVNSMSDLFHEAVPASYIAQVFAIMALSRRHTFQVLTKRHARMRSLLNSEDFRQLVAEYASGVMGNEPSHLNRIEVSGVDDGWHVIDQDMFGANIWSPTWPLPNVWLGVSVEDQKWADIRIPALIAMPAAVRFLSCEPLLGPVSLTGAVDKACWHCKGYGVLPGNNAPVQGYSAPNCWHCNGSGVDGALIDWVIVGGESGPGARPMDPRWARLIRDECAVAGAMFFFKQWGAHDEDGNRVGKHKAGRLLDGRTWDEYPHALTTASA